MMPVPELRIFTGGHLARINIEDSLYQDHRFIKLCTQIGIDAALGAMVRVWTIAQKFYLKDDRKIPRDEWEKHGLRNEVLAVGLAEDKKGRIKVRGADEQFKWLIQRVESGKKGGLAKAKRSLAGAKREDPGPKPLTLPLPLSPSLPLSQNSSSDSISSSNTEEFNTSTSASAPVPPKVSDLNRFIWESYADAYKRRYNKDPVRNAKVNGQVKQLGQRLGKDAVEVVRFFLTHNDGFYLKKVHQIGLCLQDAESLHTQWVRGRAVTGVAVKQFEQSQHTATLLEMIEKGEIK